MCCLKQKSYESGRQGMIQTFVTRTSVNFKNNASRRLFNDFNKVLHSFNLHIILYAQQTSKPKSIKAFKINSNIKELQKYLLLTQTAQIEARFEFSQMAQLLLLLFILGFRLRKINRQFIFLTAAKRN